MTVRSIVHSAFSFLAILGWTTHAAAQPAFEAEPPAQLLSQPFLQLPRANSINVVWFTDFRGIDHRVDLQTTPPRVIAATTTQLSSVFGDDPHGGLPYRRDIYRHEAIVNELEPGVRYAYRVASHAAASTARSPRYELAALPPRGQPLRILLTSDHQLKPMVAANLTQVAATVGRVDAVFMAGDLINVADRASEWFDDPRGRAFFPNLQGVGSGDWPGAPILQHAPLFPTIGNHEVMGPLDDAISLDMRFAAVRPGGFNATTYEEIFSLPSEGPGGERYYAQPFGDVFLISLLGSRPWRPPSLDGPAPSKYGEPDQLSPGKWGSGEFHLESLEPGSPQLDWLLATLSSPTCREARYKVLILHQSVHGLGENSVPVFSPPQARDGSDPPRYDYPRAHDTWTQHVEPALRAAQVDLVLVGHNHIWNRFELGEGLHLLESSNVGNSYGCYCEENGRHRPFLPPEPGFNLADYPAFGDPHGAKPVVPNVRPLQFASNGLPLPCVASNDTTIFSVLDTQRGCVTSYAYDTTDPNAKAFVFDEFFLGRN